MSDVKPTCLLVDHRVIRRPDDPYRVEQLRRKLDEYSARMGDCRGRSVPNLGTVYKAEMLTRLLNTGEADTAQVEAFFAGQSGMGVVDPYFSDAISVVADYVETGGDNLRGGSLPELEPGWAPTA